MIATASCLDLYPHRNATLAAKKCRHGRSRYFASSRYRLRSRHGGWLPSPTVRAAVFDKKEGTWPKNRPRGPCEGEDDPSKLNALLPLQPHFLILVFSNSHTSIKMTL
jgi:hypothetical protein